MLSRAQLVAVMPALGPIVKPAMINSASVTELLGEEMPVPALMDKAVAATKVNVLNRAIAALGPHFFCANRAINATNEIVEPVVIRLDLKGLLGSTEISKYRTSKRPLASDRPNVMVTVLRAARSMRCLTLCSDSNSVCNAAPRYHVRLCQGSLIPQP